MARLLSAAFGSAQPFRAPKAIFPQTSIVDAIAKTPGRVRGGVVGAHWPIAGNGIANAAVPEGRGLRRQRVFEAALEEDPALLARTGLHIYMYPPSRCVTPA